MTGHELTNTNCNNKLQKTEGKKEVAKRGKLIPPAVKKNSLIKLADTGKEVCIKATKGLIKVTGGVLVKVGNKLKEIDWGKLFLTFLVELVKANATKGTNTQSYYYEYTYTEPQTKRTVKQRQVRTSKQDYIEEKNNKHIGVKKTQSIKTNKNTKQIAKKKNAEISKKNPLMIEKKDKN